MMRAPDGSGKLELSKFHSPADNEGPQPMPSNRLGFRHISIEVDDVNSIVDGLRDKYGESAVSLANGIPGAFRERTHESLTTKKAKKPAS